MIDNKLLIVDDSIINLQLISVLLAMEGYEIKTANSAREAIELLEIFHPKVILMDVEMPEMDGLELTRLLKADSKTRDIKIIGLTAYAMKEDEERILAAGCDGYIAKPINTNTLPGIIKSYFT